MEGAERQVALINRYQKEGDRNWVLSGPLDTHQRKYISQENVQASWSPQELLFKIKLKCFASLCLLKFVIMMIKNKTSWWVLPKPSLSHINTLQWSMYIILKKQYKWVISISVQHAKITRCNSTEEHMFFIYFSNMFIYFTYRCMCATKGHRVINNLLTGQQWGKKKSAAFISLSLKVNRTRTKACSHKRVSSTTHSLLLLFIQSWNVTM